MEFPTLPYNSLLEFPTLPYNSLLEFHTLPYFLLAATCRLHNTVWNFETQVPMMINSIRLLHATVSVVLEQISIL